MKKIYKQLICFAITLIAFTYVNPIKAQIIFTFAGTGASGSTGDGMPATDATLTSPNATFVDGSGNVYIADIGAHVVRKVDPSGYISNFAGIGLAMTSGDGGPATSAGINRPAGIAADGFGNVFISENVGGGHIRKVDFFGNISTFVGSGLNTPVGLAVDGSNNLYIANQGLRKVMKVTPAGVMTTFAGTGSPGYAGDGGPATAALLNNPTGVAVDASGNVYIAMRNDPHVRMVDPTGIIHTVAGITLPGFSGDGGPATAAQLNQPYSCAVDASGNLYIADETNARVRMVTMPGGIISTVVGTGLTPYNGDGLAATTANILPHQVHVDAGGNIYISEAGQTRVRVIKPCTSGLPTVGTISGPSTVCEGSTISMAIATTGGAWSTATPTVSTINSAGVVTGTGGGVDTVKYTVINGCGATVSTMVITVDPLPAVAPISGSSTVCEMATLTLTDGTPGGLWSATNANATVVGTTGVVTGVTAGVDTIQYSISNGCGTTTVSQTIVINPAPVTGTISGLNTVCVGATITLTNSASGGSWGVTNANATVAGGIVTGVTAGVDTVLYSVTNGCGTLSATHEVTVTLTPAVDPISGSAIVCVGSTITFTDSTTGGVWSVTTGIASVTPTGDVAGVTVGIDTINYTVTLACGSTMVSYEVSVNPAPTVGAISGPTSVCVGDTITLTNPTAGGYWNAYNASAVSLGTGEVIGNYAGVDTIYYTYFNTCGAASTSYLVTVNPLPNAGAISGPTALCVATTMTLTSSVGSGTWTVTNANATISVGGVVTGMIGGMDTAYYSVTNMCGTAFVLYPFTVIALPVAGTITGPSVVCEASTVSVADASVGGIWSTLHTNASISSGGVVSGITPGLDTIVYTVINVCDTDVTTYAVTVNPLPHAGTITGATSVCVGATATVADTAAGGTWSNIGSKVSIAPTTGIVTGITIGVDTVQYTVINSCGTDFVKRFITINDVPVVAAITGADEVCVGSTITLADVTTGGTWGKSNGSVNVSGGGVVSGVAVGMVTISYTKTNVCGPTSSLKTVNVLTIPTAGSISGSATVCIDWMDPLISTTPGGTWASSNNHALVDATGVVVGNTPGVDTITYTVTNICGTASTTYIVTVVSDAICYHVGVSPLPKKEGGLKIYPNPNQGAFTFQLTSAVDEEAVVVITNMLGEQVHSFTTNTNIATEQSLNIPAGIYLLNATTAHGKYVTRIIVE